MPRLFRLTPRRRDGRRAKELVKRHIVVPHGQNGTTVKVDRWAGVTAIAGAHQPPELQAVRMLKRATVPSESRQVGEHGMIADEMKRRDRGHS